MIEEAFVISETIYRFDAVAVSTVESCLMDHAQSGSLPHYALDFVLRFARLPPRASPTSGPASGRRSIP
jgi:hypothetical protein